LTKLYNNTTPNNSVFTITNEPFKGKALTITTPKDDAIYLSKDLSIFIDQLTAGNNVIKFEIDYYTGPQYYLHSGSGPNTSISLLSNHQYPLFSYAHNLQYQVDNIHAAFNDGLSLNRTVRLGNGAFYGLDQLPINTWITFIVYLDYTNKKIYFETPYFNKVAVGDFLNLSTSTNLIEDYKPTAIQI